MGGSWRNWTPHLSNREGNIRVAGPRQETCSQDHATEVLADAMTGVVASLASVVTGGWDLGNL
jgi:hypothetical protein